MNEAMFEFMIRAGGFLGGFLFIAYGLLRHIDTVKKKYGTPNDTNNYWLILHHYFGRFLWKTPPSDK